MRAAILALVMMLALPAAAEAQWLHTAGEDNPFEGGVEHMSMTATEIGEILGFRCRSIDDLSLVYVSVEKPDPAVLDKLKVLPLSMLVIVDSEPVQKFDAAVDITPNGDRYRVTAKSPMLTALVDTTRRAKKRFALAVEMLGQRLYSAVVNVRSSNTALGELAAGCKL